MSRLCSVTIFLNLKIVCAQTGQICGVSRWERRCLDSPVLRACNPWCDLGTRVWITLTIYRRARLDLRDLDGVLERTRPTHLKLLFGKLGVRDKNVPHTSAQFCTFYPPPLPRCYRSAICSVCSFVLDCYISAWLRTVREFSIVKNVGDWLIFYCFFFVVLLRGKFYEAFMNHPHKCCILQIVFVFLFLLL